MLGQVIYPSHCDSGGDHGNYNDDDDNNDDGVDNDEGGCATAYHPEFLPTEDAFPKQFIIKTKFHV